MPDGTQYTDEANLERFTDRGILPSRQHWPQSMN